jgi:L-lactate dehydrogenase (cytochrome)
MPRVDSPSVVNIADLRAIAKKRLPRVVFDYIDGGAGAEWTMRENARVFDDVMFRPRSAVATASVDLRTTVLGETIDIPFILAPVGSSRLFWPRGEEVAARAAGDAGTIYTLSTLSGCAVRDVKSATRGPVWYQLYLVGGRDVALAGIERAKSAGCSALVVTVDTPVAGMRERDVRNGTRELVSGAPFTMLPFIGQFLARPRWLAAFLHDGGLMRFANVVLADGPMPYADVGAALEQSMVSWDDFRWIRDAWQGPIVVKGVHTADDSRQAIDHGAAALVVSNHGGRQLDGVAPTLRVLPEVMAAVNEQAEVLLDGGIRRGGDVVKALCLGARAVLVGRSYAYGLGAAGAAGVERSIEILRSDIVRTMKLLGCSSVRDLDRSFVEMPAEWLDTDRSGPLTLDEIDRLRVHGQRPLTQSIIDLARQRDR